MGYDVSGFVFTEEPNWEALQNLPAGLGGMGCRHKTQPVWLLDIWECRLGERWPMTGWLPESYQPFTTLPPETSSVLAQLQAIGKALHSVDPIYGVAFASWSAAVSALAGVETTFYAANDETVNMAMRWSAGRLQALRIMTGWFLITNNTSAGLLVQQVNSLEDEEPWKCPPEVDAALRSIPGILYGEPLTVETVAELHSSGLALWPREADFTKEMLGVGCWDAQSETWKDFIMEFERGCPAPAEVRPSLDLHAILQRTKAEAATILKSNSTLDPLRPMAALGIDELDAMHLLLVMEEIYGVKIPEIQLVEHGTMEQSLTLHRIAQLILAAATQTSIPPVLSEAAPRQFSIIRWLMIVMWMGVFVVVLNFVGLFLAALIVGLSGSKGLGHGTILALSIMVSLLTASATVFLGLRGLLPGTRK